MGFHRFTVPSYNGGLPGGYDYINNALSGTPAAVAGARADGGPNNGTYFVGQGEDGRSQNVNRGLAALAQNTDYLDDLLRRDIALATISSDVTAVGTVTSIILPGPGVYLGASGTPNTADGISTFIEVLDNQDKEIVNSSLNWCRVTAITGGTVGSNGFSAGNVTLTISPGIPNGKVYRVYYGVRSNLATMPVDGLTSVKIRNAQAISAVLEGTGGGALVGLVSSPQWLDGITPNAQTVQSRFDQLITHLSSVSASFSGADKVGSASLIGLLEDIPALPVWDQLQALLDRIEREFDVLDFVSGGPTAAITQSVRTYTLDTSPTGTLVVDLPSAASAVGLTFYLAWKAGNFENGTDYVKLARFSPGFERIEGALADYNLTVNGGRWILKSDGSNWYVWSC